MSAVREQLRRNAAMRSGLREEHVELEEWPVPAEARRAQHREEWRQLAVQARIDAELRTMTRERAEEIVGAAAAMYLRLEGFRLALDLTRGGGVW